MFVVIFSCWFFRCQVMRLIYCRICARKQYTLHCSTCSGICLNHFQYKFSFKITHTHKHIELHRCHPHPNRQQKHHNRESVSDCYYQIHKLLLYLVNVGIIDIYIYTYIRCIRTGMRKAYVDETDDGKWKMQLIKITITVRQQRYNNGYMVFMA